MSTNFKDLHFLNDNDPVTLLNSNNYIDQLVPIIKSSIKSNAIDELLETLTNEGLKKDDELTQLIKSKDDDIIDATKSVSTISHIATGINEQVLDITDHLSKTSNLTLDKKFQLLALKKNITKINESEILINKILQVLELTDKTHELIKDNRFFKALKNLNDLTSLNKEFDKDFKFLNNINQSLPILQNLIRDESLSLLKRNLNSSDNKFEQVGLLYFEFFQNLINHWDNFKQINKDFESYKINSSVELSLRKSYLQEEELPILEDYINIGYIYDTQLVFKTLDQLQFFQDEFNKELSIRRDKILYPFINTGGNNGTNGYQNKEFDEFIKSIGNLNKFLSKLTGYLIFHNSLNKNFPHILNQSTNDLWENIDTKIYQHLKNLILNEILELSKILEIKTLVGNFYLILEQFNLNKENFYHLLITIFKKYCQLSIFQFAKDFQNLANDDDSMPMIIHEYRLYKKIITVSWYNDFRQEFEIKFPQVLPFSTIFPMTCAQFRNYISQQFNFLKDFYKFDLLILQQLIVGNVEKIFQTVIVKYFKEKLNSITREELSQNLINLENFIVLNQEIGKLLSKNLGYTVELNSIDQILDAKKLTETKLFEMIDGKVEDLVDFIDWDWSSKQINREPNYFIKDIGDFLQNMFNSTFSNLPYSVKTLLLYRVFDLLAIKFLDNLKNQELLSIESILNFDLDISYVESIIIELNPAKSDNKESLQSMFTQLRQSINLLKQGNLNEYKDQTLRMRKFDQIKPEDAINLIQKLDISSNVEINSSSPKIGSNNNNNNGNNNTATTTTSTSSNIFSRFNKNNN
ncbi:hypothetical protein WICMUC_002400 [Wickerhamomyces mucosus]|uniref:Exocyst complex component SEC15 n=1 Tax=Wickerhamomyces mucosus TaxID=1378264 RepID=A0A9P8PPW0_9ASCO|nr:hypothetical protein WICMUC_002400 [Wickerhamomyces mucosus]